MSMVCLRGKFGLLLAAGMFWVSAQAAIAQLPPATPATPSHPSGARSRHKKAVAEQTAAPQIPPPPATLEQTPPSPPRVTYQNGLLTIDAQNSTLAQVLRSVQSQTGASIDMPYGASSERVVSHIGPGQPRDVLNTLLNGSRFDYIILGMTSNPGGVQKVILTPRQSTGQPVNTAQSNNPGQPQPGQGGEEEQVPVEEEVPPPNEDQAAIENQQEQQQQIQPPGRFRPMPGQGDVSDNQNGTEGQQPGAKTPEQLLQELQKMQQQQQIYQQQLNPANQEQQQQ
jgi:hypothetical protein